MFDVILSGVVFALYAVLADKAEKSNKLIYTLALGGLMFSSVTIMISIVGVC